MQSSADTPFAEILSRKLIDYCELASQGAFHGGNDTSFLTVGPADNIAPDEPKLWGIAIVTKDPLKVNLFLHACNLIIAIIVFAASVGRASHQATLTRLKGENHGS